MPGLVGILKMQNNVLDVKQLLARMCQVMKHEDWYKTETFIDESIGIGRVSLGILNPEPQPIFNEDKSLCIMMEGEVYDYQDLKEELILKGHQFLVNNDPDFILHLYEQFGKDFVHKLNGSFVLAIWDKKKRELLVVNDRYGLRPLYYAENNGYLLFGSEVKTILEDKTFERVVDDRAVAEFFAFEHILGNKTFFQRISVLPPASILTCHKNKISIEQYWDFNYEEKHFSEEYYSEELVKRFKKAVKRRMEDEHKKGVLLSGGLDSRSILAAADEKLCTFTFGVKGSKEAKIAKVVANKKQMKNKFLELKEDYIPKFAETTVYLTDGMLNILHSHGISVLDRIKDEVDIAFDGLAMDLTLGGSFLTNKLFSYNEHDLPKILFKKTNTLFNNDMVRHLFSRDYYQKIKGKAFESLRTELEKLKDENIANKSDHFFLQNRVRRFIMLGGVYLRSKVEYRTPTYDNDFIDIILSIPPELRLNHHIYIKFLKKLDKELAKIPYAKTGIRADAPELLRRIGSLIKTVIITVKLLLRKYTGGLISIPDKSGYPDYDEWIRKNIVFKNFIKEILLSDKTLSRGYFNKFFIQRMIEDHMNYRKNYSRQLCALVTFELWHRLFLER